MADGSGQLRSLDARVIAEAMGRHKTVIEKRAIKEAWPFDEVCGRGGRRRIYVIQTLPVDVREAIARQHALASAAALAPRTEFVAGKQAARRMAVADAVESAVQRRVVETGAAQAASLTGLARQRMDARIDLLARLEAYAKSRKIGTHRAMLELCDAYNAGTLQVPPTVRAAIGADVSFRTLRRWQKTLKTKGAASLAGAYNKRTDGGCVETNPALRDFAIGLIAEKPHISPKMLHHALDARFGAAGVAVPHLRSVQRFMSRWKAENAGVFQALTNPDAWKNSRMLAFGSYDEGIERANQVWMLDSTPGDLQLLDGRYTILGAIDIATRRAGLHLSKTSTAEAVCQLLRRQILDWGVPEALKMDNGADYASTRVANALVALSIEPRFSAPFSPWEKPQVERLFRTLSHGLVELLPGYIGHNVAEQQEIRARTSFAERLFKKNTTTEIRLTAAEFQTFLDRWCRDFYAHEAHEGLRGLTPFERTAQLRGSIRTIGDVRALDLLLAEGGTRVVGKKGIRIDRLTYIAPELATLVREPVRVLKDEEDLGRIVVYHDDAFVCVAECPEVLGVSRKEIAAESKARQTKAVQDAKRELKALGRKANTRDIAFEILDRKAQLNGNLVALPAPNVVHLTPALEAASEAAAALDATPPADGWIPRESTLADVAAESRVLRQEQLQDESAEARFRTALDVLMVPEAERNDIQRSRLKRAMDTSEFQGRWMVFTDFGPAYFQLPDTYLALMPEGALYHRFREAQLIQGD